MKDAEFLAKPFESHTLARRVRDVLDRKLGVDSDSLVDQSTGRGNEYNQ